MQLMPSMSHTHLWLLVRCGRRLASKRRAQAQQPPRAAAVGVGGVLGPIAQQDAAPIVRVGPAPTGREGNQAGHWLAAGQVWQRGGQDHSQQRTRPLPKCCAAYGVLSMTYVASFTAAKLTSGTHRAALPKAPPIKPVHPPATCPGPKY